MAALLVATIALIDAKTGPKTTSADPTAGGGGTGSNPTTKTSGTAGHHGPYEALAQEIHLDKKKSGTFFNILKKLKQGVGDLAVTSACSTRHGRKLFFAALCSLLQYSTHSAHALITNSSPLSHTILALPLASHLRNAAKNGDEPEIQRNATRKALNTELHTLLGDGLYAKYQAVHRKQAQNIKNLQKDIVAPKRSPATTSAPGEHKKKTKSSSGSSIPAAASTSTTSASTTSSSSKPKTKKKSSSSTTTAG